MVGLVVVAGAVAVGALVAVAAAGVACVNPMGREILFLFPSLLGLDRFPILAADAHHSGRDRPSLG